MRGALLAGLVLALIGSAAYADLSQVICDDDNDNGIVMDQFTLNNPVKDGLGEYTVAWACQQNYGPGHVVGDFITPEGNPDPIINLIETVQNDTLFAWTGYVFTIGMKVPFNVTGVTKPAGWSASPGVPPTFAATAGQLPNGLGAGYLATVTFTGGPEIPIGGEGDFGLKISFTGTTEFCTEQTPTPEPATMVVLGLGSLLLRRRK